VLLNVKMPRSRIGALTELYVSNSKGKRKGLKEFVHFFVVYIVPFPLPE
jgi:hypothetical protein